MGEDTYDTTRRGTEETKDGRTEMMKIAGALHHPPQSSKEGHVINTRPRDQNLSSQNRIPLPYARAYIDPDHDIVLPGQARSMSVSQHPHRAHPDRNQNVQFNRQLKSPLVLSPCPCEYRHNNIYNVTHPLTRYTPHNKWVYVGVLQREWHASFRFP